ncbi:YXWGXW repeat-containing protein [Terriglobus sp. 2YAB30_2]|uniref:YXWGXW repeat-containing protein n=1 Tax=unclassified Terriglobus TaxID=2628988 RepID=UPI003F9A9B3A
MKTKWLAAVVFAGALAAPGNAQVGIGVTIGTPPPPLRYEVAPPTPGPDYLWVDGYWSVSGRRYVWVPGHWERRPYAGAYYTHPHYDHYPEGWRLHEGHWDREDHGDHHDWHRH